VVVISTTENCSLEPSKKWQQVSIVSGMARGADLLAWQYAQANDIQAYCFYANWAIEGKAAGFARNRRMAENAHGLLAFWDGQSRGTKHMIDTMQRTNKPTWIIRYQP
jgi:hypothetical protein